MLRTIVGEHEDVAMFALPVPTAAKEIEQPHVYGPLPDWEQYKALAEEAIRGMLIDPESARFEWPRGYRQGEWQPFLARKVYGYTSCGYVNSRNRMGGYASGGGKRKLIEDS